MKLIILITLDDVPFAINPESIDYIYPFTMNGISGTYIRFRSHSAPVWFKNCFEDVFSTLNAWRIRK